MLQDARWTKLVLTTYKDPLGKERNWEHAERSTRPKNSPIDGVGIVAILQKPTGPELVLQKQFRPAIGKVVIEVPAGLVDEGEGAAESAVRELREETGYHGVASEISPVMFNGRFLLLLSANYYGCHQMDADAGFQTQGSAIPT